MPEERDLTSVVSTYRCGCVITDDRADHTLTLTRCDDPACYIPFDFSAHFPESEVKDKGKKAKTDATPTV